MHLIIAFQFSLKDAATEEGKKSDEVKEVKYRIILQILFISETSIKNVDTSTFL